MAIIAILVASMLFAVLTRSRLGAVAALGSLGFTVALVYVLYSAADVGITQVLVETLTVILLVLVLFRLPGFLSLSSTALRLRDAGIALVAGGMRALSDKTRLLRLSRSMYDRLRVENPYIAVNLLEFAIISLDHLIRRVSEDVATYAHYLYSPGKK